MPRFIRDASPNGFDLLLNDGGSLSSTAKFGASALQGDASSYALSLKQLGLVGDFTIEGHARLSSTPFGPRYLIGFSASPFSNGLNYSIFVNGGGNIFLQTGGVTTLIVASPNVPGATWFHWALTRASSTTTLWYGGASCGTTTTGLDFVNKMMVVGNLIVGGGSPFVGQVDAIRVTNGVARYTGAFTPPSAAFPTNSGGDSNWSSVTALLNFDGTDTADAMSYKLAQRALVRLGPGAVTPGFKRLASALSLRDAQYGGRGTITERVEEFASPTNLPLRRRVRLFRDRDGACIRETWSDPATGYYTFTGIDETQSYTVVAYDHVHNYRAVIADNLTPSTP